MEPETGNYRAIKSPKVAARGCLLAMWVICLDHSASPHCPTPRKWFWIPLPGTCSLQFSVAPNPPPLSYTTTLHSFTFPAKPSKEFEFGTVDAYPSPTFNSIHVFIHPRNIYWAPTTCQNVLGNGDSPENKVLSLMGPYNENSNGKMAMMMIKVSNKHWVFTLCQAMF